MAIPYTKITPQPANLAEGEMALVHQNGTMVAVSVTSKWMANGAGMSFECKARWIDADGTSHTCPHGQDVHTNFTHTADHGAIDIIGENVITRELTYALLGCEMTIQGEGIDAGAILPFSQELLNNVSILKAIDAVNVSGPMDVGNALGL